MPSKRAKADAGESKTAEEGKQETTEKAAKTAAESKTPNKDAYFMRMKEVTERCNAFGSCMIRGIKTEEDEDEDEEEEEGKGKDEEFSVEQLSTLRFILVTRAREKAMKKAEDFATCGQADDSVMMFNTSSGNEVILNIPRELAKVGRKKALPEKFDALFALTYALNRQDYWLHDNEMYGEGGELEGAIKKLGAAWKKMLAHSNEELGIDEEFTRPGIVALLEDFKEKIEGTECVEGEFKWQ